MISLLYTWWFFIDYVVDIAMAIIFLPLAEQEFCNNAMYELVLFQY